MDEKFWTSPPREEKIQITREEALSDHVEDLLKRQMSLRGDPSVTRTRRRWYMQNWFVFMVAGALAAIVAWAIIEPSFNDYLYVQGTIEEINTTESMPRRFEFGNQYIEIPLETRGYVVLNGEKIWLIGDLREYKPVRQPADPSSLHEGEQIGIYVQYLTAGPQEIALGVFLDLAPRAESLIRPRLTMAQMSTRSTVAGMLLFPLVAGLIGLAIGAADGIICRLPRRALLGGVVGLLAGFIGGFVMSILAGLVYAPLSMMAMQESQDPASGPSTFGFFIQMSGRALGWALAGMAMGLGQGIALRSGRLLLYGFLGGLIGGLLGGLLFDPIDLLILGIDKPSAHWSRLIGFLVIGASVGALIGLVELLARDAWLRMTKGPLAGKEFVLFKDLMYIGSSPRAEIYLFNDPLVGDLQAALRSMGNECEIESLKKDNLVLLNHQPIRQARLRHGDEIGIGQTAFVFERRRG